MKLPPYLINRLLAGEVDPAKFCLVLDRLTFKADDSILANLVEIVTNPSQKLKSVVLDKRIELLNSNVQFMNLPQEEK